MNERFKKDAVASLRCLGRDDLADQLERPPAVSELPYRYAVFAHEHYYPSGGVDDCVGTFRTLNEALDRRQKERGDERYVVDLQRWMETGDPDADVEEPPR